MYCRKCGKYIDYNGDFCKECLEKENPFAEEVETVVFADPAQNNASHNDGQSVNNTTANTYNAGVAPAPNPQANTNRKLGLKVAIIAVVLAFVAEFFSGLGSGFYSAAQEALVGGSLMPEEQVSVAFVMCLLSVGAYIVTLGLSIPSLIMSIKSIITFRKASQNGGVKPIATLILGIVGISMSAQCLLVSAIGSLAPMFTIFDLLMVL